MSHKHLKALEEVDDHVISIHEICRERLNQALQETRCVTNTGSGLQTKLFSLLGLCPV